jgi:hypothetical protein
MIYAVSRISMDSGFGVGGGRVHRWRRWISAAPEPVRISRPPNAGRGPGSLNRERGEPGCAAARHSRDLRFGVPHWRINEQM